MKKISLLIFGLILTYSVFAQDYQPAKTTKEKVLQDYLVSITDSRNFRQAEKKILQIKSLIKTVHIIPNNSPMKMKKMAYFKYPNQHKVTVHFNGLLLQETIFNGKNGLSKTMNNQQKLEQHQFSKKEIHQYKKTAAIFPEYSLLCNLGKVKLLGKTTQNDSTIVYAIQYTIGTTTNISYYDIKTGLKTAAYITEIKDKKTIKYSVLYSRYDNYGGYLFATQTSQLTASMNVSNKIESIQINPTLNDLIFTIPTP